MPGNRLFTEPELHPANINPHVLNRKTPVTRRIGRPPFPVVLCQPQAVTAPPQPGPYEALVNRATIDR
jgi:hypothetical protein